MKPYCIMTGTQAFVISEYKKSEYFAVTGPGRVVVIVAPHLCDGWLWPSPVLSFHSVLEQQQRTRNIKSNH